MVTDIQADLQDYLMTSAQHVKHPDVGSIAIKTSLVEWDAVAGLGNNVLDQVAGANMLAVFGYNRLVIDIAPLFFARRQAASLD